jgi:nucleotide-binding universal stress UspA family protein
MRTALACVDLSESSDLVLGCAGRLFEREGQLIILHVAAPEPEFVGYGVGPQSVRQAVAWELRQEHRQVEQLARAMEADGLSVTPLTVQGMAIEKILDHAERLQVDFIVLASKGHGAMHDLIVGSVLRGVLKGACRPVVVVPWRGPAQRF